MGFRPEERANGRGRRGRWTGRARSGVAGLAAGALLAFAATTHAEIGTPAVPPERARPPTERATRARPDAETSGQPGSFCTFATCRPRAADPARGVLAFGGTALVAGLIARRRSAQAG